MLYYTLYEAVVGRSMLCCMRHSVLYCALCEAVMRRSMLCCMRHSVLYCTLCEAIMRRSMLRCMRHSVLYCALCEAVMRRSMLYCMFSEAVMRHSVYCVQVISASDRHYISHLPAFRFCEAWKTCQILNRKEAWEQLAESLLRNLEIEFGKVQVSWFDLSRCTVICKTLSVCAHYWTEQHWDDVLLWNDFTGASEL